MTQAGKSAEGSESLKWKSKLLSSSVPLEFEVAKLLARRAFVVTADYPYQRMSEGTLKEFSVDIIATHLLPRVKHTSIEAPLSLLIECKFRNPNVTWLFLPDPNRSILSPVNDGPSLRAVDVFSSKFFHESSYAVDRYIARCYKGVEIDVASGAVHDAELRHGFAQLQFALPAFLAVQVDHLALVPSLQESPFFFAAVVVTNAPLMIAHRRLDMASVRRAKHLAELGREVPYLSVRLESGPELKDHTRRAFAAVPDALKRQAFRNIDQARAAAGADETNTPSVAAVSLFLGDARLAFGNAFSQILVCTSNKLGEVLTLLKAQAARTTRSAQTAPK